MAVFRFKRAWHDPDDNGYSGSDEVPIEIEADRLDEAFVLVAMRGSPISDAYLVKIELVGS